MDPIKRLRIILFVFIIGDILMMIIWTSAALFLIGILPLLIVVWLLILHIKSYRALKRQGFVSDKLIIQQIVSGTLITISNSVILVVLFSFSESMERSESVTVYIPQVVFGFVCLAVMVIVVKMLRNLRPVVPGPPNSLTG